MEKRQGSPARFCVLIAWPGVGPGTVTYSAFRKHFSVINNILVHKNFTDCMDFTKHILCV